MTPSSASESFYEKLASFADFTDFTNQTHFRPAPDDWFVVMTDVQNSTLAIEAGRYKDVNTIGAASISAVHQVLDRDFPFVFGGDGATLLVSPAWLDQVVQKLQRLQRLSREQFGLELRVGWISVAEVCQAGCAIEVAKCELTAGRCMAVFRGGGLQEAERRIKSRESVYPCAGSAAGDFELTGLSCRWSPLSNRRGVIMSLLVCARKEPAAEIYAGVLADLKVACDHRLDEANPVNTSTLRYNSVLGCVKDERRFHTKKFSLAFLKRLLEIVIAVLIFKHHLPAVLFDSKRYRESMRLHSDHRKFDDTLRMILDCTPEQADNIRDLLECRRSRGELCYGIHLSKTALMTCYVEDVTDGAHIHFVDGGDGGYALAAKQLKQQLSFASVAYS